MMARRDRKVRTFDVLRGHEPALYRWLDSTVAAKYAAHRDNDLVRDLPAGSGTEDDPTPVWFHCRALSRKQRDRVTDAGNETHAKKLAFQYGVLSISGLGENGRQIHTFVRDNDSHALEDDALKELEDIHQIGDEDVYDIGAAVIQRSFLARGVQRTCQLRHFSLEAARALIAKYHAARRRDAEEAASRESSEPPKEAQPEAPES